MNVNTYKKEGKVERIVLLRCSCKFAFRKSNHSWLLSLENLLYTFGQSEKRSRVQCVIMARDNLVSRVLSLHRESTLVTAGHRWCACYDRNASFCQISNMAEDCCDASVFSVYLLIVFSVTFWY